MSARSCRLREDAASLGIRFLASEYSTGKTHAGRIDSLGLDENHSPVILEYKRSTGENVINQGLFYLDWLMDHQAEFELLVMKRLGHEVAARIDWNAQRLAVLDHDINAIIHTHARDRKVAAWFEDTAEAFEEIGEIDLAIDWAKQATDFGQGHQSLKAADYWCRLLDEYRPAAALDARVDAPPAGFLGRRVREDRDLSARPREPHFDERDLEEPGGVGEPGASAEVVEGGDHRARTAERAHAQRLDRPDGEADERVRGTRREDGREGVERAMGP
jgi:hypothetical protein